MYTLHDTFNDRTISRHRTIEAATQAERKFSRAVKRANGQNSYIPTTILRDGIRLTEAEQDQLWDVRIGLDRGY